jgi:microsomal dipeptidase-like Zn-dependent dipeptidase
MVHVRRSTKIAQIPKDACVPVVLGILILLSVLPAFAQSSPSSTWSGNVTCQLNDQDSDGSYNRQETQTWTLTGGGPVSPTGMPVYNATWKASGSGQLQRVQGGQTVNIQWTTNVPDTPANIAIFIRASDHHLIIGAWHSQLRLDNGRSVTRQVIVNGVAQPPTNFSRAAWEWQFPRIEASPSDTNITGSTQSQADTGGADLLHHYGALPPNATCNWNFTNGASAPTPAGSNSQPPLAGSNSQQPPSGSTSSGNGTTQPAPSATPIGVLTGPATVPLGQTITMSGTQSSDAGGQIIKYCFYLAGTPANLTPADVSNMDSGGCGPDPTRTFRAMPEPGPYVFSLYVYDQNGTSSAEVRTSVTVQEAASTSASQSAGTVINTGVSPGLVPQLAQANNAIALQNVSSAPAIAANGTTGASAPAPTQSALAQKANIAPAAVKQVTEPPLTGWVDLHTHPMSNLAFGGKLFHGAPDSGATSLMPGIEVPANSGCRFDVPAADISQALSQDGPTDGDPFQSKCGDFVRNGFSKLIEAMTDGAQQQPGNAVGYPSFVNWPRWNDISHQKMWWEWIKRARDGGLRVMVALAHNNRLLGETVLVGNAGGPISGVTDDASSADLQIREIIAFVNHHTDFMELAMNSADLYRIVQKGNIAVVVGIEVDNLGDFNDKQPVSTQMIDAEINRLYGNGVRYIFPIHLTDNVFGDTALYDDLFGMANFRETGKFWTVGCSQPGDQVSWHSFGIPSGFPSPPGFPQPPRAPDCPGAGTADPYATGNVNVRTPNGLTPLGEYAIKAMMKHGMIIDIDHMSNAAVERALQIAEGVPHGGYPMMSGHSGIRNVANFNKENSRTPAQLKRVACLGGMFGLGTDGAKATDWAREYAQAFNVMNSAFTTPGACANPSLGAGMVAFGTDMNSLVKSPRPTMAEFPPGDVPRYADIYNANNPNNTDNPFLPVLPRSQTGARTWDYNADGVAHYGMLADFVRDVRTAPANQAMPGKDLVDNHLLHTADYFYRMWQKVETQKNNVQ